MGRSSRLFIQFRCVTAYYPDLLSCCAFKLYILITIKNRQILSPDPHRTLSPSIAIHNLYEQQLIASHIVSDATGNDITENRCNSKSTVKYKKFTPDKNTGQFHRRPIYLESICLVHLRCPRVIGLLSNFICPIVISLTNKGDNIK